MAPVATPAIDRFLRFVEAATSGCWLWKAHRVWGYGHFKVNGRTTRAHRFAYEHFIGPIPPGALVCHECDVHWCVNPTHLFLGTAKANMEDAVAKARMSVGSRHGLSKLTEEQVIAMRQKHAAGVNGRALAREYGITPTNVSYIVRRCTWTHV